MHAECNCYHLMDGRGLRERRRTETRRVIADAALDLVLERGLSSVTVEDIAECAGVSARTFFNYFPSKNSAVLPGPQQLSAEEIEQFVADRETPLLEGLEKLVTNHVAKWPESRDEIDRVHRVLSACPELLPVVQERMIEFENSLIDAVARRLDVAPDDNLPRVAVAVSGTLIRLALTRQISGNDDTFDADITRAFAALRGLLDS